LHIKEKSGLSTPPPDRAPNGLNGSNGVPTPQQSRTKFVPKALPNTVPLKFGKESQSDLQLLTREEIEICRVLRIMPKPYMALKELLVRAAVNNNGTLKKKTAREMCKIDATKTSQLFDFFVHSGWIARA
jgi:transcriptional adapter 2-alpha